jgi:hypothetical protein
MAAVSPDDICVATVAGKKKVRRIRERYTLGEYGMVYGDTEEDREMLEMADKKFFRWQEVSQMPEACRAARRGDGGI